jgi:hypothetical protein
MEDTEGTDERKKGVAGSPIVLVVVLVLVIDL